MHSFHRHFGVYGICVKDEKILVVNKTRGPYRNRFDLPGGSIEPNESIMEAIKREFIEEVGLRIHVEKHIGISEFIIRYDINEHTHIQHIAMFFTVSILETMNNTLLSDDTDGSEWVSLSEINIDNSSPLVVTARNYIERNEIEIISMKYDSWLIKDQK